MFEQSHSLVGKKCDNKDVKFNSLCLYFSLFSKENGIISQTKEFIHICIFSQCFKHNLAINVQEHLHEHHHLCVLHESD